MKVEQIIGTARDSLTVRRVYGDPWQQDGLIVIPAASVLGGGGGGEGHDPKGQDGQGGGFGVSARPAGAFVIKDGTVTWRPALDPNRVVLVLGAMGIAYLLSRPRVLRARAAGGRGATA